MTAFSSKIRLAVRFSETGKSESGKGCADVDYRKLNKGEY